MKAKLNKLFYWSLVLQIIATQGVLTFLIFKYLGNWEFKKFMHPLSFLIIVSFFVIKAAKKLTITTLDILFFATFSFYLLLYFLMLVVLSHSI